MQSMKWKAVSFSKSGPLAITKKFPLMQNWTNALKNEAVEEETPGDTERGRASL